MNLTDVWRQISDRIGFYTKETAFDIPETSGVYAWFLPLWLYSEDPCVLAQTVQRAFLYDADSTTRRDTLGSPTRTAHVDYNWDTLMFSVERRAKFKLSDHYRTRWDEMLNRSEERDAFATALMESTLFTKPLYVGKTDNLNARYFQHVSGNRSQNNDFHNRFTEHCAKEDLNLRVADLLFVCVSTDPPSSKTLRESDLNSLLEKVLLHLAAPPFSCR